MKCRRIRPVNIAIVTGENGLFEKLKIKFPIKSLIKKLINDIEKQTKIPEKIVLCLLITYPLTIFYWYSFSLFYYNSTPDRI